MKRKIGIVMLCLLLLCGCAGKTNRLSEAYEVFGAKPSELSRIEVIRQSTMERRRAEKTDDLKKILRVFSKMEQLPDVRPDPAAFESSYVVQFFGPDGEQLLTASYAGADGGACLAAGGRLYAVKPVKMDALWDSLSCEAVPAAAENPLGLTYLELSQDDLSARCGTDTALGYLRALTEKTAAVDAVERKADASSPEGYVITGAGDGTQTYDLADGCEFWVRGASDGIVCRVSFEDFRTYLDSAEGALWTFYLQNGEIAAAEEAFAP